MKEMRNAICFPKGFLASGIHCGIRRNKKRRDLALLYSVNMAQCACVFTQNKIKGAPIEVCKDHLQNHQAQAIIINSGNANTCNINGFSVAEKMCELCAQELELKPEDILVASTGVIGQELSIDPIQNNISDLVKKLSNEHGSEACEAIMTTDTQKKEFATTFHIGNSECHIGAIAKGSGMIHPNMATMLAFITSDVSIQYDLLQTMLKEVCDETFHMISVDGDTSTNDMAAIMCNGQAKNAMITQKDHNYQIFKEALMEIGIALSKAIAKDGEGANRLLTCIVQEANHSYIAKTIAKTIITSTLFKAAMFGKDANWGRILCAIGYCEGEFSIANIDVTFISEFGMISVCKHSFACPFNEEQATKILSSDEVEIHINMHDGSSSARAWGCDLSYDYIKINGDYRT